MNIGRIAGENSGDGLEWGLFVVLAATILTLRPVQVVEKWEDQVIRGSGRIDYFMLL
jgi:hypothetical protein